MRNFKELAELAVAFTNAHDLQSGELTKVEVLRGARHGKDEFKPGVYVLKDRKHSAILDTDTEHDASIIVTLLQNGSAQAALDSVKASGSAEPFTGRIDTAKRGRAPTDFRAHIPSI